MVVVAIGWKYYLGRSLRLNGDENAECARLCGVFLRKKRPLRLDETGSALRCENEEHFVREERARCAIFKDNYGYYFNCGHLHVGTVQILVLGGKNRGCPHLLLVHRTKTNEQQFEARSILKMNEEQHSTWKQKHVSCSSSSDRKAIFFTKRDVTRTLVPVFVKR